MLEQSYAKANKYQEECKTIQEQSVFLQGQYNRLISELNGLEAYLRSNPNDKAVKQRYFAIKSRLNRIGTQLRKNEARLKTLQRSLTVETQRINMHNQKQMMSMYKKQMRGYKSY